MYDIVIIGAGPAGSTLARMLNGKYKVLLIDKRNLNEPNDFKRQKCCGGLLAPDAQSALAHLGFGVPKDILTGPQMFSVKAIDFDNRMIRYYPRHYINVDRERFDRWLVSLIPSSVSLDFNCIFKSYEEEEDSIKVNLRNAKGDYAVKTRILVGADGAISRVRKQAFKGEPQPEKYVAVQKWYKTDKSMPHYISIFDRKVTDFYSWIIQKEDCLLVGSAIPIKERVNENFELLIRKLKKKGYIQGEAYKKTGTLIMRTRNLEQIKAVKGRVALIGEAAGFISPSSAEGISYALKSGTMLANCINRYDWDFGREYSKKIKRIRANILYKNFKVWIMYNKLLRRLIMKSKILSMHIKGNR